MQNGTLHTGDIVVAGTTVGRIRAMMNERGERVKSAGPSVPVEVTGLNEVPVGGDTFNAVSDERLARELVEQRLTEQKEEMFNSQTKVTLDNLFEQMKEGEMKELKVIVKADVQALLKLFVSPSRSSPTTKCACMSFTARSGAISESDVMLANARTPSSSASMSARTRSRRKMQSATVSICASTVSFMTASKRSNPL